MNDRFRFRAWSKQLQRYCNIDEMPVSSLAEINSDLIIEQCTGLKDKNGRLIYEGDIVRRTRNTDRATVNLQIEWNQRSGRYLTTDAKHRDWNFSMLSYEYEVLGNIHENPELLEDK